MVTWIKFHVYKNQIRLCSFLRVARWVETWFIPKSIRIRFTAKAIAVSLFKQWCIS